MNNNNPQQFPLFDLGAMNAQEGEMWEKRWCDTCYRDKLKCATYRDAIGGGRDDDWRFQQNVSKLIVKDGEGVCTKYISKHYYVAKKRVSKDQTDIFDILDEDNKNAQQRD